MKFKCERLEWGRLVAPASDGWLVRLDNGDVVVAQIGYTEGLYEFIAGERVCVALHPRLAPQLTGYLT